MPSRFVLFGLAAIGLLIAALVIWSRLNITVGPQPHSVTVTSRQAQAPTVVLPEVNGTTQAELAVLGSGTGIDAVIETAGLWFADRLIWVGFGVLLVAPAIALIPFERPRQVGIALAIIAVGVMAIGLFAPIVAMLLHGGEGWRNEMITSASTLPAP